MHCSTYYGIDVTNPSEAIIKDGYETSLGAAVSKDGEGFFVGVIDNGRCSKVAGLSAALQTGHRENERVVKSALARVL